MDLNETRKALGDWFTNKYLTESEMELMDDKKSLEDFIMGYIECGGLIDSEVMELALNKFKEVLVKNNIDINEVIIKNYLTGHGDINESKLNILEACEYNKTLSLDEVRKMIARRFGMYATNNGLSDDDKKNYLVGFLICGGTIEDLYNSSDYEDQIIAKQIVDFLNIIDKETAYDCRKLMLVNSTKRSMREKFSKGGREI